MTELPPSLLEGLAGHYTIERELGRGGMATVYLARDLRHDRSVALKVLHPHLAASLGPERFLREIRLAARLQHPHILTVLDSGDVVVGRKSQVASDAPATYDVGPGTWLWFTMAFVEGESLRAKLARERQLPLDEALRIIREAGQGLQYAHEHGVVHRDIKPENLLLTQDGNTLVADFGVARALQPDAGDARLTETGVAIGTPAYMSPEQAAGDPGLDARTDVYSLSAVLYEMLAGQPPFSGATTQAMLVRRLTEPAPSVRTLRPTVPEAVDGAIRRALAAVPADRFSTMAQFCQALQTTTPSASTAASALSSAPSSAPSSATTIVTPTRPRRVPVLALTLVLGILIGVGVLFAWRHSRGARGTDAGSKMVAVLPFENLGDSSTAYFADGITDAVRGKLSSVPGLQVIASSSSNEYRHSKKTLTQIGRELEADYLLVARVRWAQGSDGKRRVEVSPELVEAAPGRPPTTRWQQPFEASVTDVFQVQSDIAGKVASALGVALGADQKQVISEKPTANLAAYDAFLRGEKAADGVNITAGPAELRRAIADYEQAVALDSTFAQAWAQLSRARSYFYYSAQPDPAMRDGARVAAARAQALGPSRPEAQLAVGDYELNVRGEGEAALAAYQAGLRLAPRNAELLTGAALAEQVLGRWDAALGHLEHARELDPRSTATARRLVATLIRLRRYSEAMSAAERGVALAPDNLDLLENLVMVHLAQGDLAGARAALRDHSQAMQPTDLVVYLGNYWDLYWVLDDAQQQLLVRLPPSSFDNDRGTWSIVLAQTLWLRGDRGRARIYADSARVATEEVLKANPGDAQRRVFHGLALAYLNRKAEAIRDGERAVHEIPISADGYTGPYLQQILARIYLLVGEPDKALDQLEPLLKIPYYLSPGWLRVDPTWDDLRKHPRFQKLVEKPAS
jgi:serine/threonine protein kinase/tetratricopeptide (TPR) repeat protein